MSDSLKNILVEVYYQAGTDDKHTLEFVLEMLLDSRNQWYLPSTNAFSHGTAIKYAANLYSRLSRWKEGLVFLEVEYPRYFAMRDGDYGNKYKINEIWACLFQDAGDLRKAKMKLQDALFYALHSNVTYNDFEYFSFRGFNKFSLEDIKNNTLSFSSPSMFNDPLDTPVLQWNQWLMMHAGDDDERQIRQLYGEVLEAIKVRCLVRVGQFNPSQDAKDEIFPAQEIENISPLMWAHYASNHKGFCVKYKFPGNFVLNFDENTKRFMQIGAVTYRNKWDLMHSDGISFKDSVFVKAKDWCYENEVRLVYYDPKCVGNYTTVVLPEGCIEEIYLGYKCSPSSIGKMRKAVAGKNIPLYKMIQSEDDFLSFKKERIY